MPARNYSSTATAKTLTAITSTTLTVNPDLSTLPTDYPYTLVIEPDTALEEVVTVRSLNGGSVLNITRGQDGTGTPTHTAGAVIKHMITPRDMQEPQNHIEAASAYTIKNDGTDTGVTGPTISKSLHGIASGEGSVVGTNKVQTLTNKILTSPNISNPTISGTISGSVVTSANIVDGTIVDADINASAAIAASKLSGVVTPTSTDTLTNKSLTSPAITGGTVNGGVALTVDSTELNKLDGVTATTAELNHITGVTGPIQTQFTNQTSALTTHAGVTGSVHGIADTSKLAKFGSSAAGRTIFVQTTTPTPVAIGDIWIDY